MPKRGVNQAGANAERTKRKLVEFDEETWNALDLLARDRMQTFQELADEAFRDLLHKHQRPVGVRAALKASVKSEGGHKRGATAR